MKIIILSTLLLLFLLMTAAIYLCIFYEVIRLASSSYAAANNLKFGKYLRILSKGVYSGLSYVPSGSFSLIIEE